MCKCINIDVLNYIKAFKKSASQRKNPNDNGLAGLEPAASRRIARPNTYVGAFQLVHLHLSATERPNSEVCL